MIMILLTIITITIYSTRTAAVPRRVDRKARSSLMWRSGKRQHSPPLLLQYRNSPGLGVRPLHRNSAASQKFRDLP